MRESAFEFHQPPLDLKKMTRTSESLTAFSSMKGLVQCVFTDLRYGLDHGHPTTPIAKAVRPSQRKGVQSTKTKFVRSVIREVAGFSAYERRVMELLRNSKVRSRIPDVYYGPSNIESNRIRRPGS